MTQPAIPPANLFATYTGHIAAALDRARWPEVAGSIAGDDTVFVALPDRGSLQRVKRRLSHLAGAS